MVKGSVLKKSLGLLVSISLLLSACSGATPKTPTPAAPQGAAATPAPQAAPPSGPQTGGVLKVIEYAPGSPFGVPWEIVSTGIISAIPALETLLFVDAEGKVHPKLAEKYELAPDKKSLTLSLRKGVKFHDGTDFNAEAVKFNLDKQIETKRISSLVQKVEVVDSHTVKVSFNAFDNRIFLQLGSTNSVQVSPTAIEKMGLEKARTHPVGTGPFEFVSYARDNKLVYKKFANYWDKGKPYLDGIELHFVADAQTQKAGLLSGQVDLLDVASAELAAELIAQGFTAMKGTSEIMSLWPDHLNDDSPLAKQKVREAISYAMDREGLVKARGFGLNKAHNQMAFPGSLAELKDYKGVTFDQAKAKALLAEAGYPNGFKTKLIASPYVDRETATAVQGFLTGIGIQAEIEMPDSTKYKDYTRNGWRGILIQPQGFFANYNQILGFYWWGAEGFKSTKRPAELQKMFDESRITTAEEPAKVQAINKLLTESLTLIPLYTSTRVFVSSKKVNGTRHMQWASWPWWTPADAWMAK